MRVRIRGSVRAVGAGLFGVLAIASGTGWASAAPLYVDTAGDQGVSGVAADGTVSRLATVGSGGLAYNPATGTVYTTTGSGSNSIAAIAANGTVTTFAQFASPNFLLGPIAIDAGGNLYAAVEGGVDRVTPAGVISAYATGVSATGIAFDGVGGLYETSFNTTNAAAVGLYRVPAGGGAAVAVATGISGAEGVTVDPVTEAVYVATEGGIDRVTAAGSVTAFAAVDGIGVAFDPGSGLLYATDDANGRNRPGGCHGRGDAVRDGAEPAVLPDAVCGDDDDRAGAGFDRGGHCCRMPVRVPPTARFGRARVTTARVGRHRRARGGGGGQSDAGQPPAEPGANGA